jgi:hypothetical protein
MKLLSALGAVALLTVTTGAQADVVNFDEFASPPVTCCFSDTGVVGPLVYPHVTITDGNDEGFVMNGTGWLDMQTSGDNLFGTLSGSMVMEFNVDASNVMFDLINGTSAFVFEVTAFDGLGAALGVVNPDLTSFGSAGSVGNVNFAFSGIRSILISGNGDFAIDTLSFDAGAGAVPEPATWAMMIGGFAFAGAAMRRRTTKAAFAA